MKKINWKHVVITALSIVVLILLVQNISIQKQNVQLQNDLAEENESANIWYSEYKNVLNELYMLEVETGRYIEDVQ